MSERVCHWCHSPARSSNHFVCETPYFEDMQLYRDEDRTQACKLIEQLRDQRDWMVDVLVERWHDTTDPIGPLHEWMEFTWEQYGAWIKNSNDFPPAPPENDNE